MQTNIMWTGLEYDSMENCLVDTTEKGTEINSVIVGTYGSRIFKVEYRIRTNPRWETLFVEARSQHSDQFQYLRLESDGQGNWQSQGKPAPQFNGCMDIDISITPLTNTLPINRLKLFPGTSQEIQVVYLDLLEQQMVPARQKYSCLSKTSYQYENVPNDFEAVITVDELGLVVDYPRLFVRKASLNSNYLVNNIIGKN
jgi:hypothetical protein